MSMGAEKSPSANSFAIWVKWERISSLLAESFGSLASASMARYQDTAGNGAWSSREKTPGFEEGYLIFAMRPWVGNFWNCSMSWPGITRSGEPASSIIRVWFLMFPGWSASENVALALCSARFR